MEQTSTNLPLVSVVIPVYNMEQFLEETLCSVLASTYPNIEVLLMDDGSKDGSLTIAQKFASQYNNVYACSQPNGGASNARNNALKQAQGVYVLPVDADNRISPDFISLAVEVLNNKPEVKAVFPSAEFIGDRVGPWKLPPFSLSLLARKNMLDTCALYRLSEWKRVGGYREDIGREDWAFWIAVLKDGGKVVRLPQIGLYYRIRTGSKRRTDRLLLKHTIDLLNQLHPEFFRRELKGPLRYCRTWSRPINVIMNLLHSCKSVIHPDFKELEPFFVRLPMLFSEAGEQLYKARNELRIFRECGYDLVVKSYCKPNFINRIVYGFLRASKAERAYLYAFKLMDAGIGTPMPVGFITRRRWFLFTDSYSVSLKSTCVGQYNDLNKRPFLRQDEILAAIARTSAAMHEQELLHKDYSGGNILFDDTKENIPIELIDLNRIVFGKVNMEVGCKNFERLSGSDDMLEIMGTIYAEERGFDPTVCIEKIKNHVRIEKEMRIRKGHIKE